MQTRSEFTGCAATGTPDTCPKCNATVPPAAQFCGACGTSLTRDSLRPSAAPAQPPPVPIRGAAGFGAPNDNQITVLVNQQAAFDVALTSVAALSVGAFKASLQSQAPPQNIRFRVVCKSFWRTGGIPVEYNGDIQISRVAPGQSLVQVLLKLNWSSVVPSLFLCALGLASLTYFLGGFGFFFYSILIGYGCWDTSVQYPAKLTRDFFAAMQKAESQPFGRN